MPINLNFSAAPKRELLPEGIYLLTVAGAEARTSASGKDQILLKFEELETKAVMFENLTIQESSMFKVVEFFAAAGYDTSEDLPEFDPADLIGITVKAKVIQDVYEGETRNKVKKYLVA
jgi:hypothetical protein